jgi:tRNA-dihydrouridine synthase
MGCPNHSIASRGAGAGLMRTPLKAARIIKKLDAGLDVPVTAKIRTGWKDCRNGELLARIIEEFGGKLVAVHARAKEMGHEGAPDLPALSNIAKKLSIPVLGNGGVKTVSDIQAMKEIGDCEGVMIGRAALENPWIFSRREISEISTNEVQELLLKHLERSLSLFGKKDGLVLFRKHTANYLKPYQLDPAIRRSILTEIDPEQFIKLIHQIFDLLNN